MAYKTVSGTLPQEDYDYVRKLIHDGAYSGPTDVIRDGIRCLRRSRTEIKAPVVEAQS